VKQISDEIRDGSVSCQAAAAAAAAATSSSSIIEQQQQQHEGFGRHLFAGVEVGTDDERVALLDDFGSNWWWTGARGDGLES
jgi:hypothetical protein